MVNRKTLTVAVAAVLASCVVAVPPADQIWDPTHEDVWKRGPAEHAAWVAKWRTEYNKDYSSPCSEVAFKDDDAFQRELPKDKNGKVKYNREDSYYYYMRKAEKYNNSAWSDELGVKGNVGSTEISSQKMIPRYLENGRINNTDDEVLSSLLRAEESECYFNQYSKRLVNRDENGKIIVEDDYTHYMREAEETFGGEIGRNLKIRRDVDDELIDYDLELKPIIGLLQKARDCQKARKTKLKGNNTGNNNTIYGHITRAGETSHRIINGGSTIVMSGFDKSFTEQRMKAAGISGPGISHGATSIRRQATNPDGSTNVFVAGGIRNASPPPRSRSPIRSAFPSLNLGPGKMNDDCTVDTKEAMYSDSGKFLGYKINYK